MGIPDLAKSEELTYNNCVDTRCSLEDLPGAMDDWDKWKNKVREICVSNTTFFIYKKRGEWVLF